MQYEFARFRSMLPPRLIRTFIARCATSFVPAFCMAPLLVGILYYVIGHSLPSLNSSALLGYSEKVAAPTGYNWWDRSLQTKVTRTIDERLPLRNWMIRINNQLDYWILRTSRMYRGTIVVGRDGVLFGKPFIAQAFGYAPSMTDEAIRRIGTSVKQLHRLLEQQGIPLLVLGTAGKVSLMRSSVPAAFPEFHSGAPRNYDRLLKIFAEMGVPFVDGRVEMIHSRYASRGPLFPRGGTHWTLLGTYAALERPIAQILREATKFRDARIELDDVWVSPVASGTDSDLLDLMNLLTPDRSYGTVMLRTHLVGAPLPKAVVVVGSSFGAQIQSLLVQAEVAPRVLHFEYMKTLRRCPTCEFERVPVNWPEIILNETSVVILEINESAFFSSFNEPDYDYFFGFVDGLIPLFSRTAEL